MKNHMEKTLSQMWDLMHLSQCQTLSYTVACPKFAWKRPIYFTYFYVTLGHFRTRARCLGDEHRMPVGSWFEATFDILQPSAVKLHPGKKYI